MQLSDTLPLQRGMTLSAVGAGGKSTMIFTAARELARQGAAVLITTTTAIYHPDHDQRPHDHLLIGPMDHHNWTAYAHSGKVVIAARDSHADSTKLRGFRPQQIDALDARGWFDYIFVEADGAKGRPIKAPAAHEPVIPDCTALTIGVIGLDCMAKPLTHAIAHRPEQITAVTGLPSGEPISDDTILALADSPNGLFKGAQQRKVLLLNKADDPSMFNAGHQLAGKISRHCPGIERVLVTRLRHSDPVQSLLDPSGT